MNAPERVDGLRQWSWAEYLDYIESPFPDHRRGTSGTDTSNSEWAGGSFTDCLRMAKVDGYQAAAAQAEAVAEGLSDLVRERVRTLSRKPALAVNGRKLDTSRYLAGKPRCTWRQQPTAISKAGRAVRIAVPTTYACSVTTHQVMRRGAAVLALVNILQRLGHPLDVWAIDARHGYSRRGSGQYRHVDAIHVQPADEPADDGRIMFALCHPGMLRRLSFTANEHETAQVQTALGVGSGYGQGSYEARETDLPEWENGTSIILPELDYRSAQQWEKDEHCIQWISDQLDLIFGSD